MYLLDTDVLSNLLMPMLSPRLVTRLAAVPPDQRYTSSITLGELLYGAYRQPARTEVLLEQIHRTLLPNLPILPFDTAAAERYGEVRVVLERQGTPLADADLRIGAIALSRGLTVVTGNVRHFQRISDLTVENWLEE